MRRPCECLLSRGRHSLPPPPRGERVSAVSASGEWTASQADDVNSVSRALAMALDDQKVRLQLRDAWHASIESSDRKVDLRRYLHSVTGQRLAKAAAHSLGVPSEEFLDLVQRLPNLDFYLPFAGHRRSWRATGDILVGVALDVNASAIIAYDVRGKARLVERSLAELGAPLIILHAAEPRPSVAPAIADGDPQVVDAFAGMSTRRDKGDVTILNSPIICEPTSISPTTSTEDCGGGGGGGGQAPGVYLTSFYSHRDDGWAGDLEMEIRSFAWEGISVYQGNSQWTFTQSCSKGTGIRNFNDRTWYTDQTLLVSNGTTNVYSVGCSFSSTPRGYFVHAVEMDGSLSNTDDFGRRFFYAGTIPFGAVVGSTLPYYSGGGTPTDGELSVEIKLEYR